MKKKKNESLDYCRNYYRHHSINILAISSDRIRRGRKRDSHSGWKRAGNPLGFLPFSLFLNTDIYLFRNDRVKRYSPGSRKK